VSTHALSKVGNSMTTKAVKLVRPFHDLEAPPRGQHLAAELGDDPGTRSVYFL